MDDYHLNYVAKLDEKENTKHQCIVHTCEFHFQFVQNRHTHIYRERHTHIYIHCMSVVCIHVSRLCIYMHIHIYNAGDQRMFD
jgi:hypothetical protein